MKKKENDDYEYIQLGIPHPTLLLKTQEWQVENLINLEAKEEIIIQKIKNLLISDISLLKKRKED